MHGLIAEKFLEEDAEMLEDDTPAYAAGRFAAKVLSRRPEGPLFFVCARRRLWTPGPGGGIKAGMRSRAVDSWKKTPRPGIHASVNDIRSTFLDYFAATGTKSSRLAAGAAQRPDADVHQCGHGAVQERLHRARASRLFRAADVAEMRARRRQAQRSRQCRLHRAPSHVLRDAGQFLLRRLFQGSDAIPSPGTC
jgi:hypothetical protein